LKKQIVIIGLGRFGASMATTLFNMGHEVLAIDSNDSKIKRVSAEVTHAVQAEVTSEAVLKELGVSNFDIGVVAIGYNVLNNILVATILKKLGVKYIIARAMDELHGSILTSVGADTVVYPESEAGTRAAQSAASVDIIDHIHMFGQYGVTKLQAPSYFVNKNITDLGFGRTGRFGVAVLLIQRQKEVIITPDRMETIQEGDILLVSGTDNSVESILTEAKKKSQNG
jgi:trk system potassium uptake protein